MITYFCNNAQCPNLDFGHHQYCHACEDEQIEAPTCLCGAPIHARFNRGLRAENRRCLGCGLVLTDQIMQRRWMETLRKTIARARKEFP